MVLVFETTTASNTSKIVVWWRLIATAATTMNSKGISQQITQLRLEDSAGHFNYDRTLSTTAY